MDGILMHLLVKQPNGKLTIWCTDVNNFILADATPAEVIRYEISRGQAEPDTRAWIAASLENPQATYQDLKMVYKSLGQDWVDA